MDLIITIANNTDYTPYLAAVNVAGAHWVPTQELTVQQPIANHSQVVGMLSGDVGFHGDITVRFAFVGRGPGGADVRLTFNTIELDGRGAVGFNEQVDPPTALSGTTAHASTLDGVPVVLLHLDN